MSKPNLSDIIKNIKIAANQHSPEILTGIGIGGMLTVTILAVRATPKALLLIEAEKDRQNEELQEEADSKGWDTYDEVTKLKLPILIKTTWKCYLPATITAGVSMGCLIGASSVSLGRNAVLATAYSLSETALKEYREKVVETIGEKKEKSVQDSIANDKIRKNPVNSKEVIITEKGGTLCYDVISGRYFKSDIDKIKKIVNELNRQMITDEYISLNDLYYELGLDSIRLGDDLGWNISNGLIDLNFSSQLTSDDSPCLTMDYRVAPRKGFQNC